VVLCAALALGGARDHAALAGAVALALAPALALFVLFPLLGGRRVDLGFLAAWFMAAVGLTAGSGGVGSAAAVCLILVPAWAVALGRSWAPEAGAAAVLGLALAAWLAPYADPAGLGPFPELLAVAALALAAGLMALGQLHASDRKRDAAVGRRIAEVSHELRTPLTHILGFSEMIERRMFGDIADRYVEYAGLIRSSGNHLLSLVNDLLDLSKIDAGKFDFDLQIFDARLVVADVVRAASDSAARKQIALGLATPDAPITVRADEQALRRMFVNVIGNAIKFTPENGRVLISATMQGDAFVFESADTGPGIPEADRAKLGQAFERGSGASRAGGTGLGLAMVRALAELHGGTLSFHDAPEGGALVRLTLPVVAPVSAES
jgi:signal transduction histidine kinase